MNNFVSHYNKICSKSRKALEIIKEKVVNITIVEYLKNPLYFE